ncbi:MAG: hypothetical protein C5B59_20860 [Bacteroidetes bacterium]|nr:MAG: hypothetical protein C5B59_20860 [Bacteroidota bacterium]
MKTLPANIRRLAGVFMLVTASFSIQASGLKSLPVAKHMARYSVVVNKTLNNKKHKIRLYTNAGEDNILFSVNGVDGKNYQLYIFDMESKLVTQVNIRNHEISVVNNISNGNYLFQVLMEDEQVESGELTVK